MADLMPPDGGVPHFGAIVRAVELSLQRHHPDEATVEFADDLLWAQTVGCLAIFLA